MWNKNLFLLGLIALLALGLGALVIACSVTTSSSGSSADDDNFSDDDDNDDNDSGDDDTTDDDDDNDASPGTADCATVADGMINTCQISLTESDGKTQATQSDLTAWCNDSEQFVGSSGLSPFWSCAYDCVTVSFCEQSCFTACLTPADPGGTGCDHTTYLIYSCDVIFEFSANQLYWIPELDMAAECKSDTQTPWSCYATCMANNPCSNPPTQAQANAVIACLNTCAATSN